MNIGIVSLAGAVTLALGLIAPVAAQDIDTSGIDAMRLYGGVNLGVALPGVLHVDGSVGSAGFPPFTGTITFNAGPMADVYLGMQFNDQFRGQVGVGVATVTASSYNLTFTGVPAPFTGTASGHVTTAGIMATGFYDFTQFGNFVPYLSAGVGVVNVSTNDLVVALSPTAITSGSSTVLAGRVGAGFTYALSDRFSIGADYYMLFGGRATFGYNDPANANTRTITGDVRGHALSGSLKASF